MKSKKYNIGITCFICLLTIHTTAQEMWGISNSNFSGNMGIFLNPTTIVGAPYQYEINLAAFDAFAENLNVYTVENDKSVFHNLAGSVDHRNDYTYTTFSRKELQNTFSHTLIIGPSYIRNNNKKAWGIHSAFRSEVSAMNVTPGFAILTYDKYHAYPPFGQIYTTQPFKTTYASWIEIGITKGKNFSEDEHNIYKWAGNLNLLGGLNGHTADFDNLEYTVDDSSQLTIHKMNGEINNATPKSDESYLALRGVGISTTLGLTYIKDPNRGAFDCNMSNDRQRKYKYRLGISLIDLGFIHYFSGVQNVKLNSQTDVVWNGIDTIHAGSLYDVDTTLLSKIPGSMKDKNFDIWLPLAISIQFDYQIRANLFANLTAVNRIRFLENQIARDNQVNASIRYEKRRIEASLNFTLSEYKKPSMGLGFRYRFIVIGSDRLLSTLGLTDENNYDFFVGLKFQFCKKPFSPGPDCPAYLDLSRQLSVVSCQSRC